MRQQKQLEKRKNRNLPLRAAAEEKLARTPEFPENTDGRNVEEILHELRVHQIELEMQNEELKRTQEALEESRDKYLDLYDFAPVGYFTLSPAGHVVEVNFAGVTMLGLERPRLVGRGLGRFVVPEDADRWGQHLISVLKSNEKKTCDLTLKRKDDSTFYTRLESICLNRPGQESGNENPAKVIRVAMSDITEQKRLEELFRQAQKMEAVGQLAGGVAHDFRNQLTVIRGYGEMLKDHGLVNEKGRDYARQILEAAERSTKTVSRLLAFARKETLRPQVVNFGEEIANLVKTQHILVGENIRITFICCHRPCYVNVDMGRFHQGLVNLIVNARDAMPHGGELTIRIDHIELDAQALRNHPDAKPGRYVMLSVTDTGTGMTEESLSHLFEPFFTTKQAGEGTGLGLAMVHGFVRQSDGFVEVESETGKGSIFRLYFPYVYAASKQSPTAVEDAKRLQRGSETILVVEDEEPVRVFLIRQLRNLGYTVLEAANITEALSQLEKHFGQIDLLMTDIIMPEGSGIELADRIRETQPDIQILFSSGYGIGELAKRGVATAKTNFLPKPFSCNQLADSVRDALTGTESTT
jgi:two-component system cell cycle sensor histidine kinase/response regulator CckA